MKKNQQFVERLIEICGTSRPAEIKQVLNISYQSVRNYLGGRLPQPEMLIKISMRTSCSIDWLLTGQGKKFVEPSPQQGALQDSGQLEQLIRTICVEVINEIIPREAIAQPKVVVLQSSELKSEKPTVKDRSLTGRQP